MDNEVMEEITKMVNNGKVSIDKESGKMAFAFDTEALGVSIEEIIQKRVKEALENISRR